MVVILKKNPNEKQLENLKNWLRSLGLEIHMSTGSNQTVLGLVGDTSVVDIDLIKALDIVEEVKRIQEPFKNANRKFHPRDTVIQVGARNMQNFELLKELGHLRKPVLIKRGMSATLQELLMSAEYVMAGGNEQVILCERGIRTFETATRNTLDLSAVPVLKGLSHLPVVIDPSHATGKASLVRPMALAAAAAGADGLMIEVHNDPQHAWCDGPQSITPEAFAALAQDVRNILPFCQYNYES